MEHDQQQQVMGNLVREEEIIKNKKKKEAEEIAEKERIETEKRKLPPRVIRPSQHFKKRMTSNNIF